MRAVAFSFCPTCSSTNQTTEIHSEHDTRGDKHQYDKRSPKPAHEVCGLSEGVTEHKCSCFVFKIPVNGNSHDS